MPSGRSLRLWGPLRDVVRTGLKNRHTEQNARRRTVRTNWGIGVEARQYGTRLSLGPNLPGEFIVGLNYTRLDPRTWAPLASVLRPIRTKVHDGSLRVLVRVLRCSGSADSIKCYPQKLAFDLMGRA